MIDSTIIFASRNDNYYLYDVNNKELLNIHPAIQLIHEYYKILPEVEVCEKISATYLISYEEALYYYKRYCFLKRNGYFKNRNLKSILSGKITERNVEYELANCNDIVFQVTQECNLKCKYCCYGELYEQTAFTGDKVMNFDLAKMVIDYMVGFWNSETYSSYNNVIIIGFYGGEPLVNFSLVKQIVDYLKSLNLKRKINFQYSMTTNALLLNKYMDFLVENNFSLLISLDGDEKHDALRVDLNNRPSFKRVFKNVKDLQNKYPRYFEEKVQFNSVLNASSSAEAVFDFIRENFGKIPSLETIVPQGIKSEKREEFERLYKGYEETSHMLEHTDVSRLREIREAGYFFYYHLGNAYRHYSELLLSNGRNIRIPTGTCLPFMKKFFVSSSRKIHVCERIDLSEFVGTIDSSIHLDFDKIAAKYNKMYKDINKQCTNCYYAEFCSACILQLPRKNGKPFCDSVYTKQDTMSYLSYIISYLEKNSSKFYTINKSVFA
ncbi:radical SAM peptide maturase [Parabacteroides sp. AM08-6]|uniref:radical SAM peptide maturase n=1 Tax=Parabacteroides sp. AM08-6 TaxID=2292053 RepID=UPI000EFDBA48|nr:radical SAM peptide maturase [Parabacteroides sp. AM08-6]RHJ75697.1 radical SAM peptide maturase [Parabacteroides sp. AM08-6]